MAIQGKTKKKTQKSIHFLILISVFQLYLFTKKTFQHILFYFLFWFFTCIIWNNRIQVHQQIRSRTTKWLFRKWSYQVCHLSAIPANEDLTGKENFESRLINIEFHLKWERERAIDAILTWYNLRFRSNSGGNAMIQLKDVKWKYKPK